MVIVDLFRIARCSTHNSVPVRRVTAGSVRGILFGCGCYLFKVEAIGKKDGDYFDDVFAILYRAVEG